MIKNQTFVTEPIVEYNKSERHPIKVIHSPIINPFIVPGIKRVHFDPKLNPDYNFSNYVEGECNMLARSAGIVIGNNPGGTSLNPFIIYGDTGLGKTHLAHAIGLLIKEKHHEKSVLYVNANRFQNQYIESVRDNKRNEFIHFYKTKDVLILDDVHLFEGNHRIQAIIFDIFNHFNQSGKQLILTCDTALAEVSGIDRKLLSGFKQRFKTELQRPDHQTRRSILKKKSNHYGIDLSNEISEFLATHIYKNIKELDLVLISLHIQSTISRKEITPDLARQMIENLTSNSNREITIEHIQQIVCEYYKISVEYIQSHTRKRDIVRARQVSMFFSKRFTKATLASIGSGIGRRNHATVLHACKTVNKLLQENEQFSNQIKELEERLKL